jgi:hypothetical protein
LLTNNTRAPCGTVKSFGLTPDAEIVMVYGLVGVGEGAGEPLLPPHADTHHTMATAASRLFTVGITSL